MKHVLNRNNALYLKVIKECDVSYCMTTLRRINTPRSNSFSLKTYAVFFTLAQCKCWTHYRQSGLVKLVQSGPTAHCCCVGH